MKFPLRLLAVFIFFFAGCSREQQPNNVRQVAITSISPASGPGGTRVVIRGTQFALTPLENRVRFNNDSATVISASADSLVAIAPANGSSGPVSVTVAGSTVTGPIFTYTADSVDVYVAAPAMGVIYWKNGQATLLSTTQGNTGGAYGIAVADTHVYVGGYTHFSIHPGTEAAYWRNGTKTALTSRNNPGEVRALVMSGSDLYIGGGEDHKPAYWKNGVRHSLGTYSGYARVNALAISGNDVYAAGYQAGPNNDERVVYWKNGVETVLSTSGPVDKGAASIAVSGNDVYVCGTDSGHAVYWKNGLRVMLARFAGPEPKMANAIAVAGGNVYVVGSDEGQAVYWKDGVKFTLPKQGLRAAATAITFYQSDVYIGGIDGNTPVYWKNGVKVSLCCTTYGAVSSIAVVKKR